MLVNIMLYDGYMLVYLTLTCFLAGINSDQIYSCRIKADKSIGRFSFNFIFTLPLMFVYPLATVTNNYFSQANTTSNMFFLILFFILCLPLFILAFPRYGLPLIGTKPFDKILDTNTVTSGRKYIHLLLFTVGLGEIIGLMGVISCKPIIKKINELLIKTNRDKPEKIDAEKPIDIKVESLEFNYKDNEESLFSNLSFEIKTGSKTLV